MTYKTKLFSMVLFFTLFSLQANANKTSIKRSEDIGVVRGIMPTNFNIATIPEFYNNARANMSRAFGFDAEYPLEFELGGSSYRLCRTFIKDESYTTDEYIAFIKKYAGANVELSGVQSHFGVAGRMPCTYTGFKVLPSGEQAVNQQGEQQEIESNMSNGQESSVDALGDVGVSVFYLRHKFIQFRILGEDGKPSKKPNHQCAGKAEIKPALDKAAVIKIRAEIKEVGNRAMLKNVRIIDGKCTVETVVPHS
ncbi:hypothetical protein [Glaciecola sp. 1036]|uniref:hypothetical protein n=1 Tax=Alteromonadaceae TaxID=72275 RepID=UPI003D085D2E